MNEILLVCKVQAGFLFAKNLPISPLYKSKYFCYALAISSQ